MQFNLRFIATALITIFILISVILVSYTSFGVYSVTLPTLDTSATAIADVKNKATEYENTIKTTVTAIQSNLKYNYGSIALQVITILLGVFIAYK